MPRASTWEDYRQRIERAAGHLEQNLDEPCSLDRLAAIAAFSPFHFHRVFRAVTGEGVAERSRRLRLERAARRLKMTDRPVTEIAFEAGYEAHESFTRAFESAFGLAPSRYRAEHGLLPQLPLSGLAEVPATVETIGPLWLVKLRHIGPYEDVGSTFRRLAAWMAAHGLFGAHTRAAGLSYDDPEITDAAHLRYEAAFTVSQPLEAAGEIECERLPARDYVKAFHRGPYSGLSASYAGLLRAWLQKGERGLGEGPCLEFYWNTPENTQPEFLLTEICVPLEPE